MRFYVVPQENYNDRFFNGSMSIADAQDDTRTDGTLYIDTNPGTFYLWTSTSHSKYTLIVEQNIDSIPEFPSWIVLPLMITGTLVAIIYRKKTTKQM